MSKIGVYFKKDGKETPEDIDIKENVSEGSVERYKLTHGVFFFQAVVKALCCLLQLSHTTKLAYRRADQAFTFYCLVTIGIFSL